MSSSSYSSPPEDPSTTSKNSNNSNNNNHDNARNDDDKSSLVSKISFHLFGSKNEDDESNQKLMEQMVLKRTDVDGDGDDDDDEDATETAKDTEQDSNNTDENEAKLNVWTAVAKIMTGQQHVNMDTVVEIVSAAMAQQEGELSDTKSTLSAEDFKLVIQKVFEQFKGNFEDVPVDKIDPLAFLYYLEGQDARKNPSWKRRLHRFMPSIKMETVYGLHDALYLSQLAYVDTIDHVQLGLQNYKGAKYELVYCTTQGNPQQPAHFIVIKKEGSVPDADPNALRKPNKNDSKRGSIFPFFSRNTSYIEVVLVVRGTKTLEDVVSDALLEASPYRDGCAHDGVCQSGRYLVETHTDLLMKILKMSGRDKINLTLLGHSLGAGAAAIACMEFNDNDKIEATCIGFGCPALVNKEMSEEWKDKIITVISDSDCVSRMSGATAANLLMDLCEFQYEEYAMNDVTQFVNMISENASYLLPTDKKESVMKWFSDQIHKNAKPLKDLPRREVILYPPGKCIHFYRDGVGIAAVEVPCTLFNEFDVTRTMVDDHLVPTGYNALLLEAMRSHLKDTQFQFRNDVMELFQMTKEGEEVGDDDDKKKEGGKK
ncbi:lipase class 3 [Nitzschia inconspicua]|uniref:Lipase class 3 n=1 Tax=Nitzschia inconspicua TaxID=303405 RepID=A0A9K3PH88_9STRA|nr:lipase class 3 [Nitzschia inconspicua]